MINRAAGVDFFCVCIFLTCCCLSLFLLVILNPWGLPKAEILKNQSDWEMGIFSCFSPLRTADCQLWITGVNPSVLQMRTLKHREEKWLVQGHTALTLGNLFTLSGCFPPYLSIENRGFFNNYNVFSKSKGLWNSPLDEVKMNRIYLLFSSAFCFFSLFYTSVIATQCWNLEQTQADLWACCELGSPCIEWNKAGGFRGRL